MPRNRQRRGAPIAALAVASIGLFGGGVLVGNSECGLFGFFGSCQEQAKENAENIMRLADFSEAVATDLHRLRTNTNKFFFLVSEELAEIKKIQDEMISIHNHNWQLIDEQLDTFANNIHILGNCDQLLISRQQIKFD